MTTNQSRVTKGTAAGGQFATEPRAESDVALTAQAPQFGDIEVRGRGALTSAVVARTGTIEIRATIRVRHCERSYYNAAVVRRVHDSATGESIVAPQELITLGGAGTATAGRFSARAMVEATESARARLLDDFAQGAPAAVRALSPELSDRDLEAAALHGERWRG